MGGVIFTQNTEEAFRRFRNEGIDTSYYMGIYGQKDFFMELEAGKIDASEFCRRMSAVVGHEVSWQRAQYCWLGYFDGGAHAEAPQFRAIAPAPPPLSAEQHQPLYDGLYAQQQVLTEWPAHYQLL